MVCKGCPMKQGSRIRAGSPSVSGSADAIAVVRTIVFCDTRSNATEKCSLKI